MLVVTEETLISINIKKELHFFVWIMIRPNWLNNLNSEFKSLGNKANFSVAFVSLGNMRR